METQITLKRVLLRIGCNKGFAFVNFNTPTAAYRLYREFHWKSWPYLGSNKVCEVKYARIQAIAKKLAELSGQGVTTIIGGGGLCCGSGEGGAC